MTIDIKKNIKINESGVTEVEVQSTDLAVEFNVDLDILQGTLDNQLFLGNSVQSAIGVNATSTATRLLTDTGGRLIVRLEQLGTTAVDVNTGASSAGTIRTVLASNDPAVTLLGTIDSDTGTISAWNSSGNCKVDINAQTLTALKISKDANANATGNRIFTSSNIDQLNGNTINLGEGTISTGTLRVSIATDDDSVGYLNTLQGTVSSSRVQVNLISGQAGIAAGSGTVGATVPRMTLASDDPGVVSLGLLDDTVGTDGSATGTKILRIGGTDLSGYDQTLVTDTNGCLYVVPYSVPSYENTTDGEANIRVKGVSGTLVGSQTGTAVDTSAGSLLTDEVLAQITVGNYTRVSFEIYNAGGGGANDIDRIVVYGSNSGSNWGIVHDSSTGIAWATGALGTGDGAYLIQIESNSYRYMKVGALCAAGSTTVDCYCYAS